MPKNEITNKKVFVAESLQKKNYSLTPKENQRGVYDT
jgi:hypothetical protein